MSTQIFNYVDGDYISTHQGNFSSVDPTNNNVVAFIEESSDRIIEAAFSAAKTALPKWSKMPLLHRWRYISRVFDDIDKTKNNITNALASELGRWTFYATLELDIFKQFCIEICESLDETKFPQGVMSIVSSWVTPIVGSFDLVLASLLAGNTVVWKPNAIGSYTSSLLAKLLTNAGLPPGVFNVVYRDINSFMPSRLLDLVSSSYRSAMIVRKRKAMQLSNKLPPNSISITSSRAMMVVYGDVASKFYSIENFISNACFQFGGQAFSRVDRIFVESSYFEEFADKLATLANRIIEEPLVKKNNGYESFTRSIFNNSPAYRVRYFQKPKNQFVKPFIFTSNDNFRDAMTASPDIPAIAISPFDSFRGLIDCNRISEKSVHWAIVVSDNMDNFYKCARYFRTPYITHYEKVLDEPIFGMPILKAEVRKAMSFLNYNSIIL